MKSEWTKLYLFGALLSALAYAGAEPLDRDAVMTQEIVAPLNASSMDDYLIDMARAAGVNVIADATEFPAASPVVAYPATSGAIAGMKGEYADKWGPILLNLLGDYMAQKELSVLRSSERTFLLWSEPDPRELLELQLDASEDADADLIKQAIVADKAAGVQSVLDGEPIPTAKLNQMLRGYLEYQFGWTGKVAERNASVNLTTRFTDLPPSLRALAISNMRRRMVSSQEIATLQGSPIDESDARVYVIERGGLTIVEVRRQTEEEEGKSRVVTTYPLYISKSVAPQIEGAQPAKSEVTP